MVFFINFKLLKLFALHNGLDYYKLWNLGYRIIDIYKNIIHHYTNMTKIFLYIVICFFLFVGSLPAQDTLFYEDFSDGSVPYGWEQEFVEGSVEWHVVSGSRIGGTVYVPDTAAIGDYNANFIRENPEFVSTKLITPPVDLEFVIKPELQFWHAQVLWGDDSDELKVYYREGDEGEWSKLVHYSASTEAWVERQLLLETQSDSVYLAFEGLNYWNNGVCVDGVTIIETDTVERHLTDINTFQATTDRIAAGSDNNVILGTELRVYGNEGDFIIDDFTVNSLNSDDYDIKDEGVKLFLTNEPVFNSDNQISPGGINFINGKAEFTDLNLSVPTGYSYIWVTYDIKEDAGNLNIADGYIPENGIRTANDTLYPPEDHNPEGERIIYRTVFHDDFDTDKGWKLTGEFERDIPMGLGGTMDDYPYSGGSPGADNAYIGEKVIGTDLTGLGDKPGNYELNIVDREYQAISPEMNLYYYKDIVLNFQRWLNIYRSGDLDKATIDVSTDGGENWEKLWRNSFQIASSWSQQSLEIPEFEREESVRIRFTLGPTGSYHNYSGWNIDNLFITGNYISRDVGVINWRYPNDGCGHTGEEEVKIVVKNFGAEPTPMEIPVGFSLDGGENWVMDVINLEEPINPKDSITYVFEPKADLSEPGRYNNVIAKTFLEGDQDETNDEYHTTIFAIPTYELPYAEDFNEDDGLWTAYGDSISWEWGEPAGDVIDVAQSGQYAWITDAASHYNSNESSWGESPCYAFPDADHSVIEFWLNTHTHEGVDGVSLQYSGDEGESWTTVEPLKAELVWNWYTNENINSLETAFGSGKGWEGRSKDEEEVEGWFRPRVVLPDELSGNDKVKFRFVFASDDNHDEYEGVAFDQVQLYEAPPDVGVVELIDPESDCELPEDQTIKITIKNFGINTIEEGTEIPVAVDVNEADPVYEDFQLNKALAPEDTVHYTFETTFDLSEVGDHSIIAYTMLPGDTDFYEEGVFNDTLETGVTVHGYPDIAFEEDIYTTKPGEVTLDAGDDDIAEYLWMDGFDGRYYDVQLPYTYEYSVTVTDIHGCASSGTIMVVAHDLATDEIISPVSDCELGEDEQISVKIKNVGPDTISSGAKVPLSLYHEEAFVTKDTFQLKDKLVPDPDSDEYDNYFVYTFEDYRFDLSEVTTHNFKVYHEFRDADADNDTINAEIDVYGYPYIDLGNDIGTTEPDTVVLDAGEGFETYEWCDGSTEQTLDVEEHGIYTVEVTNEYYCPSEDSVEVAPEEYDLAMKEIVSPDYICEFAEEVYMTVEITNEGNVSFQNTVEVEVGFSFEEQDPVIEQVEVKDLPPGESFLYSFETPITDIRNVSSDEWDILAWLYFDWDINNENDTISKQGEMYEAPHLDLGDDIYTIRPDTVTLDAGAGFDSYVWQDGSEDRYFDVTSKYSKDYSVIVTDEFGCFNEDTVRVNTFDIAMEKIIEPQSSCTLSVDETFRFSIKNESYESFEVGDEFTFEYKINNDIKDEEKFVLEHELSPGDTYTFQSGLGYDFSGIGEYDVMIYYTGKDGYKANDTISQKILVEGLPEVDIGNDIYTTQPDTVRLDAGEGFYSYEWQDGSEEQIFEVTSTKTRDYSVIVTNKYGCTDSDTIRVNTFDLALEELIEPQSYCTLSVDETFKVEVKNTGHETFEKGYTVPIVYIVNNDIQVEEDFVLEKDISPGETITINSEEKFDLSATGDYEIKVYHSIKDGDALNDTLVENIEVSGLPEVYIGEDIYSTQIDTIVLNAGRGFDSYYWHDGSRDQVFYVYEEGIHWVEVTDIYGCQDSDTLEIVNTTDVEDIAFSDHDISLYPNPVDDYIYITLDLKGEHKVLFHIVGMSGNIIEKHEYDSYENDLYEIYVGNFDPGIYFLRVIIQNQQKVIRFIKQ